MGLSVCHFKQEKVSNILITEPEKEVSHVIYLLYICFELNWLTKLSLIDVSTSM